MITGSGKKIGAEGRRRPRRIFRRLIGVLWRGEYNVVQGLQLSEGGLLFEAPFGMKVGDQIVVTLVMPGAAPAVVRAEITYDRQVIGKMRQIGVRFGSLQIQTKRTIRSYVTAKTQEEAENDTQDSDEDRYRSH